MLATFLEAFHVGFRLFNSASVARPRLCDDVNADAWKLPQLLGDTGDPEQRSFSVGIQIDQQSMSLGSSRAASGDQCRSSQLGRLPKLTACLHVFLTR